MNAQTVVELYTSEIYRRTAAAGLGAWDGWVFTPRPGMEDAAGEYVESLLPGGTSFDAGDDQ